MENCNFLFKEIQKRLAESLEKSGISMRAASRAAGLGNGYVHSMLKSDIEPSIKKLSHVCEKNNINLAYVLLGIDASKETLALIDLCEKSPDKRDAILKLLADPPQQHE